MKTTFPGILASMALTALPDVKTLSPAERFANVWLVSAVPPPDKVCAYGESIRIAIMTLRDK